MTDTIRVQSGNPDSKRIALWERDDAHPGGEVMVGGDRVVEVAVTTEVARRLAKGTLVRVTSEDASQLGESSDGDVAATGTPPEGTQNDSGEQPLPEDLTALLAEAGYETPAAVQSATDEELLAINGIGSARLATIRAALPHVPTGEDQGG